MLKNVLLSCGLNVSEQMVTICLLERGVSIASVIAKVTGLKRPTVYAALDSLQDYGLVLKQKRGGVTYFSLIDLDLIPVVLENRGRKKLDELKHATKALRSQLVEYEHKQPVKMAGFDVQAIDSVEGIYAQLESSLMGGDFSAIFNPQLAFSDKQVKDVVVNFLKKTGESKPQIREICVAGEETNWYRDLISNPNHEIKEISADQKIMSDMIFADGAVFVAHYQSSKEAAIKIVNSDYYHSMMCVFEMLWRQL